MAIYKKTFVNESERVIYDKIDDHLAFVEGGINDLHELFKDLTKGNVQSLEEQGESYLHSFEARLERMSINLSDMYTLKNDLLESLEKMKEDKEG